MLRPGELYRLFLQSLACLFALDNFPSVASTGNADCRSSEKRGPTRLCYDSIASAEASNGNPDLLGVRLPGESAASLP